MISSVGDIAIVPTSLQPYLPVSDSESVYCTLELQSLVAVLHHRREWPAASDTGEDTYTVDVDREVFIRPEEVVVDPSSGGPVVVVLPHVDSVQTQLYY